MLQNVSLADLGKMANDARSVLRQLIKEVTKPQPRKTAPHFNSSSIVELCKLETTDIRYLSQKHDLPYGEKIAGSKARRFTLDETILWSKKLGNWPHRPEGKLGKVMSVVNYKGGVAKTTTVFSLAQGLTLRGLKVLVIDCDGQGTATQLAGINPEEDVEEEQTILPLAHGDEVDLRYAVQPTYWSGLYIIPSCSLILGAEFALPARAIQQKGFDFFKVMTIGVEPLRQDFDVIIFDTSPALSNVTINCMLAADFLVMPCPPENLDFASSVQFWGVYSDLTTTMGARLPKGYGDKRYDYVTILPTKVKAEVPAHQLVRRWMNQAYQKYVNPLQIPDSTAASGATALLKTVYDLEKPLGSKVAFTRLKQPTDAFCDQIIDQLQTAWSK